MGNRTQWRQQRSPGLPLGTSLRCPTLSNSPGKLREFLEHSKLVPPLKWPQGAHATMSSYIMLYKHPNHWHVFKSSWRHIRSKPQALTQASRCQNLSVASWCLKLTGSVHTSYRNSISRILCGCKPLARESSSAPRTQIPSPKIIPSVDQQSTISYLGWFRNCHRLLRHTISIAQYYVHSSLECRSQRCKYLYDFYIFLITFICIHANWWS